MTEPEAASIPSACAEGGNPGGASRHLVPLLLLLGWGIVAFLFGTDDFWRPNWDSGTYLVTAQSLVAGEGYTYLGEPFFLRPPGYAWLLGFLMGDGTIDPLLLNRFVMLTAIAAVIAIYFGLVGGFGGAAATAVALLTGTAPLFVQYFSFVLPEYLFLALLWLAFVALQRSGKREARWWIFAILGALFLAAAIWLRTVALVMLPGLLFLGLRHDRGLGRLRPLLAFGIVLAASLPWFVHSRAVADEVEVPREQLLLHDYATALFHVDPGNPDSAIVSPAGWGDRVLSNGARVFDDLSRILVEEPHVVFSALVLLLAGIGWGLSVRRGPTLVEWFTFAYVGVLLTYFTHGVRLALPLVPLLFLYGHVTLAAIAKRLPGRHARRFPVALAALLLGGFLVTFPRHADGGERAVGGGTWGAQWADVATVNDWLRENTPPDARILCSEAPVVSVLSERTAFTFKWPRRAAILERLEIDYVVFTGPLPERLRAFGGHVRENAVERWDLPNRHPDNRLRIFRMR